MVNLGKLKLYSHFLLKFTIDFQEYAMRLWKIKANFATNSKNMKEKTLPSIYNMVCTAPAGSSLHIDHMPDFFDYDTMDNNAPHVHTFYEIIWFQEAGGIHTVDFQDYPIEENSLFFLSPGQVHHFDRETRHKGLIIRLCTDFLKDERADEDIFIKYNVFNAFDSSPCCTISDPMIVERMKGIVEQMETELKESAHFGHIDMLRVLTKQFLINVQRYGNKPGAKNLDAMKPSHRLFVMFRQLLEREYDHLHAVKEYASRLNVSVKTLSNCISECSDKSALAFINDRILLEAKRLVRHTDLRIKEIAYRLGFEDSSYFVKFFKRNTGYLPSDFRETP